MTQNDAPPSQRTNNQSRKSSMARSDAPASHRTATSLGIESASAVSDSRRGSQAEQPGTAHRSSQMEPRRTSQATAAVPLAAAAAAAAAAASQQEFISQAKVSD